MAAAQLLGSHQRGRIAMRAILTALKTGAMGLDLPNSHALVTLLNASLDNFAGTAPQLMERNIESEGQG